jgi:hypothetical protein
LGRLGNIERLPDQTSVLEFSKSSQWTEISNESETIKHQYAQSLLHQGKIDDAWKVLLLSESNKNASV